MFQRTYAPRYMAYPTGTPGRRARSRLALCLGLCLTAATWAAAGCGSSLQASTIRVEVRVEPQSNQNSPIPVTLVAVHDPKLHERFSQMSAKQWYEQRDQLRRDFPGGDAFTEWEWEFVPGFNPPPAVVEIRRHAVGAFVFANYRAPGQHRIRLGPHRRIRINLAEDDVTVSTLEAPEGS